MAISDLDTYITAARAAIGSADWVTAEISILQAEAELAITPDTRGGDHEMRYRADAISSLRKAINQKRASSLGVQTTKHTYVDPS